MGIQLAKHLGTIEPVCDFLNGWGFVVGALDVSIQVLWVEAYSQLATQRSGFLLNAREFTQSVGPSTGVMTPSVSIFLSSMFISGTS